MAKLDRTKFVDEMLADGSWEQVRKFRKAIRPKQGRLKNTQEELVDSDCWAHTMAKHFEELQKA